MGMLRSIKNVFRRQRPGYTGPLQKREITAADMAAIRRFDTALNRLNRYRWTYATGQSINADLADRLPEMMSRCANEAAINPLVSGALETLETDIVGRCGPRMQVVSEDQRFNDLVEHTWASVWAMPDPTGTTAGPENLRLWVRMLNLAGSYLNVFANVRRSGPVSFGWRTIHPRRLVTPARSLGNQNFYLGVEYNAIGEPIQYHIAKQQTLSLLSTDTTAIPASLVQHRFIADEPEQLTGYPALWPCLETVADLREYDIHVMLAAKNAAAHTPYLQASHPEAVIDPEPLPAEGITIEPGQATAAPLGWSWQSVQATQPTAQYREFRHERLRELGLALGMPLMMVLLSSADSNFASAHYDGAVYLRRIKAVQSWIERRTLNDLVEQVVTELVIAGKITRPEKYSFHWTWEVPPYVNPEKQRKADRMAVEDGAMPLSEYSASLGLDFEDVVFQRQRENELLASAGLPLPPVNHGESVPRQNDNQEVASVPNA